MDDSWGEECVTVRGNNETKVHESANEDLIVFEDFDDVPNTDGAFGSGATLVLAQSSLDVGALFIVEPFCVLREIRDEEEEEDGDNAGEETFEYEDPAPSLVAANALHLAYGRGKEATEGTGKRSRAEEEGISLLGFTTLVPHADKVEGARKHAGLGKA